MFQRDVEILAQKVGGDRGYKAVYGVPRGGVPVALKLAQITGLPLIDALPSEVDKFILVVDDIMDSGRTRMKYRDYNFACLHVKPHTPCRTGIVYYVAVVDEWISYWWEGAIDQVPITIEDNIVRVLELIGENPRRLGLLETPSRVAKMYGEFFCGYHPDQMPKITTFENGVDGLHYSEMLRDEGYFFSFCEHHMLPFFGQYYYGYIPDAKVIGASKIGRVVDYYAGRLQVAERLVNDIVSCIDAACQPLGQVLVMNARHLCKEMRGLRKWNSPFEAIAVRGYFAENRNGCKDEFMARIK